MKKNSILIVILVCSIIAIVAIITITNNKHYNTLVIKEKEWLNIINNKTLENDIKLENITFNDYHLMMDKENKKIYYSVVESFNQYNPLVGYKTNDKSVKIAFKEKLTEKTVKEKQEIEVIFYNKTGYQLYHLVVTDLPIMNISYDGQLIKNVKAKLVLFDNRKMSAQRVTKSLAILILTDDNKYMVNLKKDSLGHNERKNDISIFGEQKGHVFILKKRTVEEPDNRQVELLINDKYQGIYILEYGKK